jgi:hypothetical protein
MKWRIIGDVYIEWKKKCFIQGVQNRTSMVGKNESSKNCGMSTSNKK